MRLDLLLANPYRAFFPAAWAMGIWGGLVWVLFYLGGASYPVLAHPQSMVGGFLFGHVMGFLLTAGPRFTGTGPLKPLELVSTFSLYIGLCVVSVLNDAGGEAGLSAATLFGVMFAACGASLVLILGGRFLKRTKNPPREFIFLPMGLLAVVVGALLRAFGVLPLLANLLLFEAFILSLVLGIGGRLAPFLLGFGTDPTHASSQRGDRRGDQRADQKTRDKLLWPYLLLFWITYALEVFLSESGESVGLAKLLRATVVLYLLLREWRILSRPKSRTK
ncbi:MAG: NnrS family protein, partial [Bdellovibrionales bacterium]|nr:NnrS family protein [Bdellovibrionales bacterium]